VIDAALSDSSATMDAWTSTSPPNSTGSALPPGQPAP
jgi:hypothetical protein